MQIADLAVKLQALGLTDKEARVFLANLFLGPSSVQKIAEQAEINRPTTYLILDKLQNIGLVSHTTENKKTVFLAEGPEALESWLDAQEAELKNRRKELRELTPVLRQNERETTVDAPVVRFFKGEEGADTVSAYMRRKAKAGETIYAMTNVDEILKLHPDALQVRPLNRAKKSLSSQLFYSYSQGKLDDAASPNRVSRSVNRPVPADINLYENSVSLVTYHGKDSIGIIIESADIVAALRLLFELAWDKKRQ